MKLSFFGPLSHNNIYFYGLRFWLNYEQGMWVSCQLGNFHNFSGMGKLLSCVNTLLATSYLVQELN